MVKLLAAYGLFCGIITELVHLSKPEPYIEFYKTKTIKDETERHAVYFVELFFVIPYLIMGIAGAILGYGPAYAILILSIISALNKKQSRDWRVRDSILCIILLLAWGSMIF